MIEWCQKAGWQYRIRLKSNLILDHRGEITTGEAAQRKMHSLIQARFNETPIELIWVSLTKRVILGLGLLLWIVNLQRTKFLIMA